MNNIFSQNISQLSKKETLNFLNERLLEEEQRPLFLVTLNPEIALMIAKNDAYAEIFRKSIAIVDGFGIKLLATMTGKQAGERITGVELTEKILQIASAHNLKTTIALWRDGFSSEDEVRQVLKNNFSLENFSIIICDRENSVEKIGSDTQVLIVGFGAPYQEIFIDKNFEKLTKLRLAIGVGGTFDYWTGKKRRAPKIFRKCGMEWLWRFLIQPNRIKRIWNAVVVFPYYAVKYSRK